MRRQRLCSQAFGWSCALRAAVMLLVVLLPMVPVVPAMPGIAANAQSANRSPARRFRIEPSQIPPSCTPSADQVALYVDANCQGQCEVKGIGTYPNPGAIGLPNGSVSSICVGANVKAVLCRNDNDDSGDWFDYDVGNLSSYNSWDNQVSSLRVESRIPQLPGKAHDPSPASGSTLSYRGSLELSWQLQARTDHPVATLSASRVTTNATIAFGISGFPAADSIIVIWWRPSGNGVVVAEVTTDATGASHGDFRVPTVEGGTGHRVEFRNVDGDRVTSVPIEVAPRIKVVPPDVQSGHAVDVWLRGFARYETVRVRWQNSAGSWVEIARGQTSSTGSATFHLTVPEWVASGANSVRGDGSEFRAQTNAVIVAIPPPPVQPTADLSTNRGTTNSKVGYTIADFPANQPVVITWFRANGGTVELDPAATDAAGAASGFFRVPTTVGGPGHRVRFTSGTTTLELPFDVAPRIKVVPSEVQPGQTVEVWLRGFAPGETVRLRWCNAGGNWVEIGRGTTSGTGSYTFHIPVPDWVVNGPNSVRGDGQTLNAQTNTVTVSGAIAASDAGTPAPAPSPTATESARRSPTPTPVEQAEPSSTPIPSPPESPTTTPTPESGPTAEPTVPPEPESAPTATPAETPIAVLPEEGTAPSPP